jgi:hypothetical protein
MSNTGNESNGWIPWGGRACGPDLGNDTLVEVRFRDGEIGKDKIKVYHWAHSGKVADIVAYRIVKPESAIERMDMDVLREAKEIQAARQERKEFFDKLDKQGLLFETYLFAVMGRFQCDADQAGKYIHEYLKGE